jgi:rhodanese-related sulfurtransferase
MFWIFVTLITIYVIDLQTQERVSPGELVQWIESGKPLTVIDVRSSAEYTHAHVPGALHVP